MDLPKFLIADSSSNDEVVYVLHTEYPRFLMDVTTDELEFFEEIEEDQDGEEFKAGILQLIEEALTFYDKEMGEV